MEALQNPPFGYKARSRSNTPILLQPDDILDSSMHDRDAMLLLILNLITENQSLRSENTLLRSEMHIDEANSSAQAKQAATCSGTAYMKPKSARQETLDGNIFNERFRKPCIYCREKHTYGSSHCKAFGAVCTFCQGQSFRNCSFLQES